MSDDCTWEAEGQCSYFSKFTEQLFQFVTWESQKYYVIEDVLNNCEVVEQREGGNEFSYEPRFKQKKNN